MPSARPPPCPGCPHGFVRGSPSAGLQEKWAKREGVTWDWGRGGFAWWRLCLASLLALLGRRDAKKPIGSRALLSLFGCAINADNVCDACHAMCGADAAHLTCVVHVAHAVIQ